MIEFKIIACPDRSQQSTYQHVGTELTMGRTDGDMILDDPAVSNLQLRISHQNGQFLLENLDPKVEVRLNGRPVQGACTVKEKDNLNVGRTTISFSRMDLEPISPPDPYQYPHAATRFADGSKEKAILDALEFQVASESEPLAPPGTPGMPPIPGAMPRPPIPPAPGNKPPLPPGIPPLPRKN